MVNRFLLKAIFCFISEATTRVQQQWIVRLDVIYVQRTLFAKVIYLIYCYIEEIIFIIHFFIRFEGHLKSHRRSHISERSFSCSYCHKRFVEKGNIMRHMKKYHPGQEMLPNVIELPKTVEQEQQQCVIGEFFIN